MEIFANAEDGGTGFLFLSQDVNWKGFKAKCKEHYGVVVDDKFKPSWLEQ